jgi:hypothetical protein
MTDTGLRKRISFQIIAKFCPIETFLLTAPIEPFKQHLFRLMEILPQAAHISTHTEIIVVAYKFGIENGAPFRKWRCGAYLPEPLFHVAQFAPQILLTSAILASPNKKSSV